MGIWIPGLLLMAAADAGFPGLWSSLALPLAGVAGLALALAARSDENRRGLQSALLALLPLLALLAVYAVNPTHRMDAWGAPVPVPHWRAAPGTAFRPGTLAAGGRLVAALTVFVLSAVIGTRSNRLTWILLALIGGGIGLIAIQQRIMPRPFPVFEYTGIFVSPNHFAAFANLSIPLALGAGIRARYRAIHRDARSNPSPLFFLAALLMSAAIAGSRSRAGTALLLVSVIGGAAILWRLDRRYGHWRPSSRLRSVLGLPLLLALAAAAALTVGRFRGIPSSDEWAFRGRILRDTLAMWRDRPAWGVGPGAFAAAFPYYQSDALRPVRLLHAHCEPAQFLAEFGALGALIAIGSCGACAWRLSRTLRADRAEVPRFDEIERPAAALALATVALHALVDFPFRAPAIALLAAFCAGQCCRGLDLRPDPGKPRHTAAAGL